MSRITSFLKTKKGIALLVVLLVAVAGTFAFGGGETVAFDTAIVERRDIGEEVSVSGRVEAATDVDLSFERGGQVALIYAEVGDAVAAGDPVLALGNGSQSARLAQAQADLDVELIKLDELRGGTGSGVTSAQNDVQLATIAFENAEQDLINEIQEAFINADDAVRNDADGLFENPETSPQYGVTVESGGSTYSIDSNNLDKKIEVNTERRIIGRIFDDWKDINLQNETEIEVTADVVFDDLRYIQDFLNGVAILANELNDPADATAQSLYNTYRTNVSSARTTINAAIAGLRSAIQVYQTEEADLAYVSTRTSAGGEDVRLQEARVASARARVAQELAALNEGIVRAPVDGRVTSIKTRIGEVVSANTPVATVESNALYQIVLNIPEADLSKVSVGNRADVTLDAYSNNDIFEATVVSIDLSETIIDGVATYEATLEFNEEDERILSGMTANADILGEERENVIAITQRALVRKDGKTYVRVVTGESDFKEIEVETGIRGSDGYIEIVSGLEEDQEIVTFIEE